MRGQAGSTKASGSDAAGFGDAITPAPNEIEFPSLLHPEGPRLKAYPRETVVAEKLQAIIALGIANSRMKDFYDVWLLASRFSFDGTLLALNNGTEILNLATATGTLGANLDVHALRTDRDINNSADNAFNRIIIRSGGLLDPKDKSGLSQLTYQLLATGGSKTLTPEQVEEQVQHMNGNRGQQCFKRD